MTGKKKPTTMTVKQAMHRLMTRPCINVWPELGLIFDVGKSESSEMVRRGEVEVVRAGRLIKPISAPLRKKLKIDEAA
jgi:hypothetical protein